MTLLRRAADLISPFNFPMALAAGPAGAALVAGSTGKAGGDVHYVQQYRREQSRTVVGR